MAPSIFELSLCSIWSEWHNLAGPIANSKELLRQEMTGDQALQPGERIIQNLSHSNEFIKIIFAFEPFNTRTS